MPIDIVYIFTPIYLLKIHIYINRQAWYNKAIIEEVYINHGIPSEQNPQK